MIDTITDNNIYTIIDTHLQYGQIIRICNKENVRSECEKLRKLDEFSKKNNDNKGYFVIEVINNATGEIRKYWNSEQNETLF